MAGVWRRALALAGVSAAALVAVAPAAAHVFPSPAFIAADGSAKVSLSFPNERTEPMTGFVIRVPEGLEIRRAYPAAGWDASTDGSQATWSGGPLAPNANATFDVEIHAAEPPGIKQLEAEWLYEENATVRWPVVLTVTPAEDSPSQNLGLAAIVGGVGLLVAFGVVLLARRRSRQ